MSTIMAMRILTRPLAIRSVFHLRYYSSFTHNTNNNPQKKLYDTHIPIPFQQRALLAAGSALTALFDPLRGDMVAALGETTGTTALKRMRDQMLQSESGRQILRERPVINTSTIDFPKLREACQPGTFGHLYVSWLDAEGVTPDSREPVHFVDDEELAYVMQRYRQCHDFYHALTGLGVTVEEELALKWFEWAQTGLPMTALSSIFGPIMRSSESRKRLFDVYVPWAVYTGKSSVSLISVYFEKHFYKNIDELRRELGIITPPQIPHSLT
ncbi:ubiquinone biosynthesis protein Coq4 [Phascolomyces articulosus]|uniref:4-hydroxy-3-methoxy-5-polyprenylbenzoate decarboxylase n=1 Tax=Phascolomyces articulosus TaxID=60185 RepID=A0AAD5PDZ2_9FUNG|nr:ubiquinone biosynthesis protein Coq4 [Phascolomyces articulosus]